MKNPFRYFNCSPEIIRLAVMMYVRYPLSLRQVEDLLFERGIDICHEMVRFWWNRFGPVFAADIRKCRIQSRSFSLWKWHLDEVFVRINGEQHYLWRAVDQEGEVLELFVTKRRDRKVALNFLHKAMKRYGRPEVIVTDLFRSCPAAMEIIGNAERQKTGHWLNNRAENSHQPFRRPERAMGKLKSVESLQKFTSVYASVHSHFNQGRHLHSRQDFKANRSIALAGWRQIAACIHMAVENCWRGHFSLTAPVRSTAVTSTLWEKPRMGTSTPKHSSKPVLILAITKTRYD